MTIATAVVIVHSNNQTMSLDQSYAIENLVIEE